jgi:hypothetical protein
VGAETKLSYLNNEYIAAVPAAAKQKFTQVMSDGKD